MSANALEHLRRVDPVMGRLMDRVGACAWKPERRRTPFEALVRSVAYQQLHGTAAAAIVKRMLALYPGRKFPSPQEILATPEETLRGAGLSRSKVAAIRDLAARTIEGVVPDSRAISRLKDEAIVERLTTVRGVGPWTVHMLLIFKLGRPDVLPTTDFGVRKGFSLAYGRPEMPTPGELLAHGEIWRPFRTYAAWYLWRACDLPPAS